jgi:hypothetical protein
MTENKTVDELCESSLKDIVEKEDKHPDLPYGYGYPYKLGFKAGYASKDAEVNELNREKESVTTSLMALNRISGEQQEEITKLEQALGWKEIDRKGTKTYEIMKHSQAFMEELVTMMKEENKRLEQALAVAEEVIKLALADTYSIFIGGQLEEALEKIKAIKEGK